MTDVVVAGETSGSGESDVEGDEEPLFADDLEDLPPLPPPMPSLAQLQDEAANAPNSDQPAASGLDNQNSTITSQGPPQKKRKPLLTLTMDRVFSDKGLPYVEAEFPKLKFKGERHEVSDLKYLLQQYEHWANMMYPKLTCKDVMLRIQRLSTTREFKMQLTGMRRRHARGGVATPPLVDSDDEDNDSHRVQQNGGSSTSTHTGSASDHTHIDVSSHTHTGSASDHTHIDVSSHTHTNSDDHMASTPACDRSPSPSMDDIHEALDTPSASSDPFLEDRTTPVGNYASPLNDHTHPLVPSESSHHEEDLDSLPHSDHTPVTPNNHSHGMLDLEMDDLACSPKQPDTCSDTNFNDGESLTK